MIPRIPRHGILLACLAIFHTAPLARDVPPPGFKIAFLGDQGMGPGSEAALKLVKDEGADLLVHLGDYDYLNNPQAWEAQTNRILGADFPQIAVVGNHDLYAWNGTGGYAQYVRARLLRMGVSAGGEPGVKSSFRYKGIFFVLTAPGLMGTGHAEFIRRELEADSSIWRISAWHVNQSHMQVGSKPDEAGWGVYEESRLGGAIIATAHEHSYSRTFLLENMTTRKVASRSDTLTLRKGRTFAFVSGLGGGDIRPQVRTGDWWASVYSATQGAVPGAMFASFNVDGNERKASFYFKAINGKTVDRFDAFSEADRPIPPGPEFPPELPRTIELDPLGLGIPLGARLRVDDVTGRAVASIDNLQGPVSLNIKGSGLLILRFREAGHDRIRKIVFLR
jgi:hypothetical protein